MYDVSRIRAYTRLVSHHHAHHCIKSICKRHDSFRQETRERELQKYLESTKWYLWHGNVEKALDCIEDCYFIAIDDEIKYRNKKKLEKYLEEFQTYIENNDYLIVNYGEKWRYGETISTAFVESTINEVVAKRMVKKQQMQWTHEGAHYLIQTRTAVLNNELHEHFARWFPGFAIKNQRNNSVHMRCKSLDLI